MFSKPLNSYFFNAQRSCMGNKDQLLGILEQMDTKPIDENVSLVGGNNDGTFPYSNSLLIMDDDKVLGVVVAKELGLRREELQQLLRDHRQHLRSVQS